MTTTGNIILSAIGVAQIIMVFLMDRQFTKIQKVLKREIDKHKDEQK
jgi:hypothetical protein